MTKPERLNNQGEMQESAEEIREKITSLIEGKKKLTSEIWDYVFQTRDHVLAYFEVKGIEEKNWKTTYWLINNGYSSFYSQVATKKHKRFTSWNNFLIWMGQEVNKKYNWDKVFASPDNVREYLKENNIDKKNWQNGEWLVNNEHRSFYRQVTERTTQVRPNKRFESWDNFKVWMGEKVEERTDWDELFSSSENVNKYLEKNEIEKKNWMNSNWMNNSEYKAFYRQAVSTTTKERPNKRFDSWDDFLIWMGEEIVEKIGWDEVFNLPENAMIYLDVNGLLDKNWRSSEWLANNGYACFYVQAVQATTKLRPNKRFKSWDEFLIWMGEEVKEKTDWDEVFKSPENVREYLKNNNIEDLNWRSTQWLSNNGYSSFYQQATNKRHQRFESWTKFLVWMGEDIKEKTDWDEVFKSPENVREYLKNNNIEDLNWRSTVWLNNEHGALYFQAVRCQTPTRLNKRFESWNKFLVWMGEEVEERTDWDQVFKSPINVREYLKNNNIEDSNWRSTGWLKENQYSAFSQQALGTKTKLRPKPRFSSWDDFLIWMGEREAEPQIPVSDEIIQKIREGIKDEF